MADQLFPVFEIPDIDEVDDEYDAEYKRSVKWDPVLGDFARDNAGNMIECGGCEAFAAWCFKMVQTERYDHSAYLEEITGYDLGSELEEAVQESDHDITESMIIRTITDTLMTNPRTEYVNNFEFEWEGDNVHFSFDVKGIEWDETFKITF